MEATPKRMNPKVINEDLEKIDGVKEVHDLHIWGLNTNKLPMSVHMKYYTPMTSLKLATEMINKKYGIKNTTIQIEVKDDFTKFYYKSYLFYFIFLS